MVQLSDPPLLNGIGRFKKEPRRMQSGLGDDDRIGLAAREETAPAPVGFVEEGIPEGAFVHDARPMAMEVLIRD